MKNLLIGFDIVNDKLSILVALGSTSDDLFAVGTESDGPDL
jgi:hypothetical protein